MILFRFHLMMAPGVSVSLKTALQIEPFSGRPDAVARTEIAEKAMRW
jgi:hypothetical protein